MRFLDGLRKGEKPKQTTEVVRILPYDVRYALKHRAGILNSNDVETLAYSGFENEAFYLTLKGIRKDITQHKKLLESYIRLSLSNSGNDRSELRQLLDNALKEQKDFSVDGRKLAQFSAQGFELWQDKLKVLAQKLSTDNRNIFLVAHAVLVGLDSFVQTFSKTNKTFNILIPSWLEMENAGYSISFEGGEAHVEILQSTFDKRGSVLVDDTQNTGATLETMRNYLVSNGSREPEIITLDKASK